MTKLIFARGVLAAWCGLACGTTALACDATGAFGVEFGSPVPRGAPEVSHPYFSGGTGLVSYSAPVPAPIAGFDNHALWSHRDRRAVYAVVAWRQLISEKKLLWDDAYRQGVLEKTKPEIRRLAQSWEQAHGLAFKPESPKELTWTAENQDVRARIGTMGGEFLYVECENKRLQKDAGARALSAVFGS